MKMMQCASMKGKVATQHFFIERICNELWIFPWWVRLFPSPVPEALIAAVAHGYSRGVLAVLDGILS
jgi:hypothetical protein